MSHTEKKGKGGKILFLKFTIRKNTDYVEQLSLAEFIDQNTTEDEPLNPYDERIRVFT